MILKSLKLENIRSYTDEEIIFPDGSVLLSGDIGSGKSTILIAIEFALFGLRRGYGTSLLRHGKNSGAVELRFAVDSQEIIIRRSLKRGNEILQDSGYVIINGMKKEGTVVELKSMILDILGYPQSLLTKTKSLIYRYTVYTPQEEMKAIIIDEKESRLDTLRKVFGFDKYKTIKENSMIITKSIRERIMLLRGKSENIEEKKSKLDELNKKKSELQNKIAGAELELMEARKILGGKIQSGKELEKKVNEFNLLKKDLEIADAKLNEKTLKLGENKRKLKIISDKISSAQLPDVDAKEEAPAEKSIIEKEHQIELLLKKQFEIKSRLEYIDEKSTELFIANNPRIDISKKKSLVSGLMKKAASKEKIASEHKKICGDITAAAIQINEQELSIKNSEKIKSEMLTMGKCPTCLQNVSKEYKEDIQKKEESNILTAAQKIKELKKNFELLSQKKMQLDEQSKQSSESEMLLNKTNIEIENLEKKIQELNAKEELLKALDARKTSLLNEKIELEKQDVEKFRAEIDAKRAIIKQIQEKKNLMSLIAQNQEYKKEIEESNIVLQEEIRELNDKFSVIRKAICAFTNIESEFQCAAKEIEELRKKTSETEIHFAGLKKDAENIDLFSGILADEIREKQSAKNRMQELMTLRSWIEEHFLQLMSTIENHLMQRVYFEFNEFFKKWFEMLIDSEVISARLDNEFTPVIEQNGYETSIENLSGGEKTACALAYRLALNKVINDLQSRIKTRDIIILDEPTDGFSTEQLDRVREVVNELNMRQIILVSHESKIEGFVDNIIRIEKREHASAIAQ